MSRLGWNVLRRHADGSDPRVTWMATDHETERARYGYPALISTFVDIELVAAQHLTALGPGRLLGREEHDDATATTRWKLRKMSQLSSLLSHGRVS